jgi:hypothetical protein
VIRALFPFNIATISRPGGFPSCFFAFRGNYLTRRMVRVDPTRKVIADDEAQLAAASTLAIVG